MIAAPQITLAPFCSQTFLHNAELEFRWLLGRLGYDEWTADLRAFQMTALLAADLKRMNHLWLVCEESL